VTRTFGGFLVATDPAVAVPRAFLTDVLPQITEIAELQATLAVFRLAAEAGGLELPVSEDAIFQDRPLRTALRVPGSPREPDARIRQGLDLAVGRGTLLAFTADGQVASLWYYVNTPVNQGMVAAMSRGAVAPPEITWQAGHPPRVTPEKPNVFRLYEQNIGLLTPLIADHLVSALERYPQEWIEDAIAEAVAYNRRSWRYVQRILEQWAVQGRA
jgi:DNA replication protein